jgi:hypothetical protein
MARKEKTIHYLYKTTCLVTNRYYIGIHSTSNLNDDYMGSGKRLRRSIRKHGVDNHIKEIIEFFENRELLIEAEKKSITEDMVLDENCMNLMGGGNGGFISEEHYNKLKKIVSENQKKKFKNTEYYEKIKLVLLTNVKNAHKNGNIKYDNFKGKTHSDDTKQKMSDSSKGIGIGETNSQYGTCWITKEGLNKKIKKEELDSYLNDGWVKGRKIWC